MKAHRLAPGDTVGIVSPSWGGAGAFPHRTQRGIHVLESLGFRVEIAPHALNKQGFTSDTPENRTQDIHDLFTNPAVKAIIAAIGGDHACHLLPHLDFELIRRNPKIFMGFSDVTVLNVALWVKTSLVTFNGPALLTDFAEFPQMFSYTQDYFQKTLMETAPVGMVEASPEWTEEFLDWGQKQDLIRPRKMLPSPGWTWLKTGRTEGPLIGGCLESLQHLRGTQYWPDWHDALFFFELSEGHPPPETVDGILMDYQNMGVFEQIRGMLVGRPMRYADQEKEDLRQVILERTQGYDFPIISDMDFGHTSPQFILPLGCQARMDVGQRRFEIVEAAVR